MAKTAFVIRHVPFEDLGNLAPVLAARGFEARILEAGRDDIAALDPGPRDLLVILGGPIGADQDEDYPFLRDELRLVERCLARDGAVLGICLGAQIMARALGCRIHPAARPEIGWAPITLTDEGRGSWLAPLAETDAVFHWHGDTFERPEGSRLLASTPVCPHQAFAHGSRALAVQFHLEVLGPDLERWYIGHAHELSATEGVTVHDLRRGATTHGPALQPPARRVWEAWLDAVESEASANPPARRCS